MGFIKDILQILFPIRCKGCKKEWTTNLCADCAVDVPLLLNNSRDFTISAYSFRDPLLKEIIWDFKYKNKKNILDELFPYINDILMDELEDRHVFNNFQQPILVPIPLHTERQKERGYNQAEIIAYEIFMQNGSVFEYSPDNLIRVKNTVPQARLKNKMNRQKNITDAFEVVDKSLFHNRNIILVDDVTTTGATLREAKKTLRKAGARNVIAFTIAK